MENTENTFEIKNKTKKTGIKLMLIFKFYLQKFNLS